PTLRLNDTLPSEVDFGAPSYGACNQNALAAITATPNLSNGFPQLMGYNFTATASALLYNGAKTHIQETALRLIITPETGQCNVGYQCLYSKSGVNGTIVNFPNSFSAAVELSNGTIDTSVAVAKQLAIYETWNNNFATFTANGRGFG